uniref:Ig-like domain-containing protein n=1 Tax=Periophthalmus magnuspinnatus TaxID=409849 RepID=A0A3B3ZPC9_9GOBI
FTCLCEWYSEGCRYSKRYSSTLEKKKEKPVFLTQLSPVVSTSEGGEVSFNYKTTGDPHPDVKWFKGAFQIQPSRNCIIIANPDGSGYINLKSVKQEDSGLYTCKATNQFGEASCSAELVGWQEGPSEHGL